MPPPHKPALRKAPGRSHPLAPEPVAPAPPEPAAMLCARVPAQLRDEVKIYAVVAGSSVQQIVREAVEHYLAAHWPPHRRPSPPCPHRPTWPSHQPLPVYKLAV